MARPPGVSVETWLAQVLQQHGPGRLPYREEATWTIRTHLLEVVQNFPSLTLHLRPYTHTNGDTVSLLMLQGTLPMYYMGRMYNLPVAIWLAEGYPGGAPIAYVEPTPEMAIKAGHPLVTPTGLIRTQYLTHWQGPQCNLVDMCQDMSMAFASDPPLYTRSTRPAGPSGGSQSASPSQSPGPRPGNPYQPNPAYPGASGSASTTNIWGIPEPPRPAQQSPGGWPPGGYQGTGGYPTPPPARPPAPPGGGGGGIWGGILNAAAGRHNHDAGATAGGGQPSERPAAQQEARPTGDLQEVARARLLAALTRRLQGDLAEAGKGLGAEASRAEQTGGTLRKRADDVSAAVAASQAERAALEACVLELSGKSAALTRWLAENEPKKAEGPVDADEALVPADTLSRQALDAQAEDLAIEDCLYRLEMALIEGGLTSEVYLKQVRNLCRKQFLVRSLGKKVGARQAQLQRAFTASQQPQPQQRPGQGGQWPPAQGPGGYGGGQPYPPQQPYGQPPRGPGGQYPQQPFNWGAAVQLPQGDSWVQAGITANPLAERR